MKFTPTTVAKLALPAGSSDKIFFDDELAGFGIRVRAGGSRKYVVDYRLGTKQTRLVIGHVAAWPLEEARKKARKVLVDIDEGRNPSIDRKANKAAAGVLFKAVADDYLATIKPNMKPRSYEECARHLKRHAWLPLHKLAISHIDRATVAANLRTLAKKDPKTGRGGPVAANRARSTLSAMFTWAFEQGLCDVNPVTGTTKAEENDPRERVLADAELATIWTNAPAGDYGNILKLLFLTGCRRDEIGSLKWSEIVMLRDCDLQPSEIAKLKDFGWSLDDRAILLPGDRTKNWEPNLVPLCAMAEAVLDGIERREGRDLVFGRGKGGYSGWSRSKERFDEKLGSAMLEHWTPHDLRRTASTRMGDCGVDPHVIEAAINHVSGHKAGVAGTYNRSKYAAAKCDAFDRLEAYLKTVVARAGGANVTKLPTKKRG